MAASLSDNGALCRQLSATTISRNYTQSWAAWEVPSVITLTVLRLWVPFLNTVFTILFVIYY